MGKPFETIVLFEDERIHRECLARGLYGAGMNVHWCATHHDFFSYWRARTNEQRSNTLVLLDVKLEGIENGGIMVYQLITEPQANIAPGHIVFITAQWLRDLQIHLPGLTEMDVLEKGSISMSDVTERIRHFEGLRT